MAGRSDLFYQYEDRNRGDPQNIHHATYEQESHERPAAADTISAVPQSELQRAYRVLTKAPVPLNKKSGDWHCVRHAFLSGVHW